MNAQVKFKCVMTENGEICSENIFRAHNFSSLVTFQWKAWKEMIVFIKAVKGEFVHNSSTYVRVTTMSSQLLEYIRSVHVVTFVSHFQVSAFSAVNYGTAQLRFTPRFSIYKRNKDDCFLIPGACQIRVWN